MPCKALGCSYENGSLLHFYSSMIPSDVSVGRVTNETNYFRLVDHPDTIA
jgi:hypothetical protein